MNIIVESPCFVKGELLKPGENGAPIAVSKVIGAAAITCGRAVKATAANTKKQLLSDREPDPGKPDPDDPDTGK